MDLFKNVVQFLRESKKSAIGRLLNFKLVFEQLIFYQNSDFKNYFVKFVRVF